MKTQQKLILTFLFACLIVETILFVYRGTGNSLAIILFSMTVTIFLISLYGCHLNSKENYLISDLCKDLKCLHIRDREYPGLEELNKRLHY